MIEITERNKLQQMRGLMFRSINRSPDLLFKFDDETYIPIHSHFVFFPFRITWFGRNDEVIESRIVFPGESGVLPAKPFASFLEEPLRTFKKDK